MISSIPPAPGETGGAGDAELQTDVMRFFALLAICLVALMSLAREPAPDAVPPPDERPTRSDAPTRAKSEREPPVVVERATPESPPAKSAAPDPSTNRTALPPTPLPTPTPQPQSMPEPEPAPQPKVEPPPAMDASSPPAPAREEALALRFATPEALMRLEAAGQVEIYAVADGTGYRWSGRSRRFVAHPLPEALYLMNPATVPSSLETALARASAGAQAGQWGVTLSESIRSRLQRALESGAHGLLLIDAAGLIVPGETSR